MKIDSNLYLIGLVFTLAFYSFTSHAQDDGLLASAEEVHTVILEPSYTTTKSNSSFEKKYHYLVARSYFKLLAEAHKSEHKLKEQFERFSFENEHLNREGNNSFQKKFDLAHKKYKAHIAMLAGLKSWNLFSEDRTGDMFYFMAENEDRIFQMYKKNFNEDKMITYLIHRLADLYHLEE